MKPCDISYYLRRWYHLIIGLRIERFPSHEKEVNVYALLKDQL
jgi:hypothetical protein